MSNEIIIKVEKPETKEQILEFKEFKLELKSILKKGKMKTVEKFRDFTVTISETSSDEQKRVAGYLKENNRVTLIS